MKPFLWEIGWCFIYCLPGVEAEGRGGEVLKNGLVFTFFFVIEAMNNEATNSILVVPSKQKVHKLCFLQKLGCQKPCCDQARLL